MNIKLVVLLSMLLSLGCARVMIQTPKEPIKVDISMRLDIYQHIEQDIDDIESIVSGSSEKTGDKQGFLNYFVRDAYAQEELSSEVKQAALRRRDRRPALVVWQERQVVGENKSGLVEIRKPQGLETSVLQMIDAENGDRMIIYQAVAVKNASSAGEVQELYAQRLQEDAPAGCPIEVLNEATGTYEWKTK